MEIKLGKIKANLLSHKKDITILLSISAILYLISHFIVFLYSPTSSLEARVFIVFKKSAKIEVGQIIVIKKEIHGKEILLIKEIFAKESDIIMSHDSAIKINDKYFGECASLNVLKENLKCITSRILQKGEIFIGSKNKLGFDSRYQEFGIIYEKDVLYNAYPLF